MPHYHADIRIIIEDPDLPHAVMTITQTFLYLQQQNCIIAHAVTKQPKVLTPANELILSDKLEQLQDLVNQPPARVAYGAIDGKVKEVNQLILSL